MKDAKMATLGTPKEGLDLPQGMCLFSIHLSNSISLWDCTLEYKIVSSILSIFLENLCRVTFSSVFICSTDFSLSMDHHDRH